MKNYFLIIFVISLFFVSCIKKDEDSTSRSSFQAIDAPFLTAADFTSTNELYLSSSAISAEVSSTRELWNYKASSDSSSTSIDNCYNNFKYKLKTSDTIQLGGSEDITACISAGMTDSSDLTLSLYKVKAFIEIQCVGVDLSAFDNQNIASVSNQIDDVCGLHTVHILNETEFDIDVKIESNGSTSYRAWYKLTQANIDGQGNSCVHTFDGTQWLLNGCVSFTKTHYYDSLPDSSKNGKDEITRVTDNNLVRSTTITDPFFISGSKDLYLQGWSGSVTYSGVNSNAAWSVTKDGVTLTGSLTPTYNLQGNKIKLKPIQSRIQKILTLPFLH